MAEDGWNLNRSCDMMNFCFTRSDFTLDSHEEHHRSHDSHESAENHGADGTDGTVSLDARCQKRCYDVLWYMCPQLKALRAPGQGIQGDTRCSFWVTLGDFRVKETSHVTWINLGNWSAWSETNEKLCWQIWQIWQCWCDAYITTTPDPVPAVSRLQDPLLRSSCFICFASHATHLKLESWSSPGDKLLLSLEASFCMQQT